jgi:hypothetical protein
MVLGMVPLGDSGIQEQWLIKRLTGPASGECSRPTCDLLVRAFCVGSLIREVWFRVGAGEERALMTPAVHVPPREEGECPEWDRQQVGNGAEQQHRGGHLRGLSRGMSHGESSGQAGLDHADAAGSDGQRGQQPDEGERGQGRLPGDLGLGQPGSPQAGEQDEP